MFPIFLVTLRIGRCQVFARSWLLMWRDEILTTFLKFSLEFIWKQLTRGSQQYFQCRVRKVRYKIVCCLFAISETVSENDSAMTVTYWLLSLALLPSHTTTTGSIPWTDYLPLKIKISLIYILLGGVWGWQFVNVRTKIPISWQKSEWWWLFWCAHCDVLISCNIV